MRLLVQHGADPKFVHHADWVGEQGFGSVDAQGNRERADGGGGNASRESRGSKWRSPRAKLSLWKAVKLAVELGADLNLVDTDGRTALDAAKALRYPVGRRLPGREGRQGPAYLGAKSRMAAAGIAAEAVGARSSASASAIAAIITSAPSVRLDSAFDLYNTTQ